MSNHRIHLLLVTIAFFLLIASSCGIYPQVARSLIATPGLASSLATTTNTLSTSSTSCSRVIGASGMTIITDAIDDQNNRVCNTGTTPSNSIHFSFIGIAAQGSSLIKDLQCNLD